MINYFFYLFIIPPTSQFEGPGQKGRNNGPPNLFHSKFQSEIEFPKCFELLDKSVQNAIKPMWLAREVPLLSKLKLTDPLFDTQPTEVRREYRRWRFEEDRETVSIIR